MILQCKSEEEAREFISKIQVVFPKKIFNFKISKINDIVYLIVDGQIDLLTPAFWKSINANCVFSSLEKSLFFVNQEKFRPHIKIGRRIYSKNDQLLTIIAGPCEIENYDDLYDTAVELKKAGVSIFRAMPRKPRTSPYNFQGVGDIGWKYLAKIKKETGLPVLAEVFSQEEINLAVKYEIDMIQIGSRNMQNYDLIKRAAESQIPTILKKGMWCNNEQLLKAAEYFFVYGNGNVILTERGIQTHECTTRNTFDISSIGWLKEHSCLPVAADASHGTGVKNLVTPINTAAVLLGADVIEVEVHISPDKTIKPGDYYQMLNIGEYKQLLENLRQVMALRSLKFDFEDEPVF